MEFFYNLSSDSILFLLTYLIVCISSFYLSSQLKKFGLPLVTGLIVVGVFIGPSVLGLISNDEIGLLALKFVEIIGEDEISDLDADSVYFIVHLLNQAKIKKLRNKVLITALPLRS